MIYTIWWIQHFLPGNISQCHPPKKKKRRSYLGEKKKGWRAEAEESKLRDFEAKTASETNRFFRWNCFCRWSCCNFSCWCWNCNCWNLRSCWKLHCSACSWCSCFNCFSCSFSCITCNFSCSWDPRLLQQENPTCKKDLFYMVLSRTGFPQILQILMENIFESWTSFELW